MPDQITAHEQPIEKIFSEEFLFSIPGYQRPYAWTTEQAGELFDDLSDAMRAQAGAVREIPPYFLGSIVLTKVPSEGARPRHHVIDGQQRLTTLTILLSALRDCLDSDVGLHLTSMIYERGNPIRGHREQFRLQLREKDRVFFEEQIQREGMIGKLASGDSKLSDSQGKIRENARLLLERVRTLSADEMFRLTQFIAQRCYLVVVATPDRDSAYRIFAVMNSRGLDLAPTDILKSEILGGIEEADQLKYERKWEEVEDQLGRDPFTELFSHIRMIYRQAKPKGTLLKEFAAHVPMQTQPKELIDELISPMASAFSDLRNAAFVTAAGPLGANEPIRWLNRIEFNDWTPPALLFARRFGGDADAMHRFFHALERLVYSHAYTRAYVNERIDRYSQISRAIACDEDLFVDASPLQLSSEEKRLAREALDGQIYTTLNARVRTTLLLRLDALLSDGSASYSHGTISVEHVLPQTPQKGGDWTRWIPDEDCRANWTHRIGNLALLTQRKNSAASNFDFPTKKEAYFKRNGVCPFPLTTDVLAYSEWTESVIAARQRRLVSYLAAHWQL